jgi:tetratricopeptide (TPR) repeat protein
MFKHGEAAEARGDYDTAVDMYQKAIEKSPNDLTYKTALYRVRLNASSVHMVKGRKLLLGGDDQGALVEFLHASEIDPGNDARAARCRSMGKPACRNRPAPRSSSIRWAGRWC